MINKFNFSYVFDLQNSSRTSFYRKYLFSISNWSSTETTLEKGKKKKRIRSRACSRKIQYSTN